MPVIQTQISIRNLPVVACWAIAAFVAYRLFASLAGTLLVFGLAMVLAIILDGPIRYLDRRGLSRGLSVLIILVALATTAGVIVAVSVRPVFRQAHELIDSAPRYGEAIQQRVQAVTGKYPYLEQSLENGDVGRWLNESGKRVAAQIGRFSLNLLGGLVSAILIVVAALYTVLEPRPLLRGVVMAAPLRYQRFVLRTIVGSARQIQAWALATLRLMVIVGLACGAGLWIIGVKWPLLFGILAGLGEAIPTIGPILTAMPPALVALADDPIKAVWVVLLFLIVQQLENHLLVPRIMAAALKLHPVSVLFFVVALGTLLGPVGVLLAAPLCSVVKVAVREFRTDAARREARATACGDRSAA